MKFKLSDKDIHNHLKMRMIQRGITKEEIEKTMNYGWDASNAKPGTFGKVYVFNYNRKWEGKFFKEKEVIVYYKVINKKVLLLTVKAKYVEGFPRR